MSEEKSAKILIVDDEPDILELMAEEFSYSGFDIVTAISGNQAIEILKDTAVDVVISDYKMPDGNGRVLLDYVKTMPDNKRPDFYFVSGQADISIEEALVIGAKNFYPKPFDLDELVQTISTDIKNRNL